MNDTNTQGSRVLTQLVHSVKSAQRHYYWLDIISIVLGCVLLTEFFHLLNRDFFNSVGFAARLDHLVAGNSIGGWDFLLTELARHAAFFAPLSAVLLALGSLLMILLIVKRVARWLTVVVFLFYYLSHLHYPGTWLFEYLMPLLIALCIAIASSVPFTPAKLWPRPRLWLQILIIAAVSCLLWYSVFLSEKKNHMIHHSAFYSAISFAVLLVILIFLDRFRSRREVQEYHLRHPLIPIPWMDILTIIIGAMLVFQIYEDYLLKWFTLTGYKSLTEIYQTYTSAPRWMADFVKLAGTHAPFLMPIQVALESVCALMLVILVLRVPFTILAFLLFATLSFIEFGVPATWPASSEAPLTWTWELLFTTTVTFCLVVFNLQRLRITKPEERFKLGTGVFGHTRFITRIIIAMLGGIILSALVVISGTLKEFNHVLAIESGLTLFFYLLLLSVIDFNR